MLEVNVAVLHLTIAYGLDKRDCQKIISNLIDSKEC